MFFSFSRNLNLIGNKIISSCASNQIGLAVGVDENSSILLRRVNCLLLRSAENWFKALEGL